MSIIPSLKYYIFRGGKYWKIIGTRGIWNRKERKCKEGKVER
jgi:hypothetical protein